MTTKAKEQEALPSELVRAKCALGHEWIGRLVELPKLVKADAEGAHATIVRKGAGGARRRGYRVKNVVPCTCPSCNYSWVSYSAMAHG
jgi:hypothetical protein